MQESPGGFKLEGMHSKSAHVPPPSGVDPSDAWEEEDSSSLSLGAILALVLFLLAASAYAQDAEDAPLSESAGTPAPAVIEEPPATADIAPADGSSGNPLDPGTPAPVAAETSPSETPLENTTTEPQAETPAVATEAAPPLPPNVAPTEENTTVSKRERTPAYKLHRPNFGFALGVSPVAGLAAPEFAGTDLGNVARSFQLQAEYQPAFLQAIGVLGIGVCGSLYKDVTNLSDGTVTWSAGGQIRYQFRYFQEQWVVPTVSFGAEYGMYQLSATSSGTFFLMYPAAGGMLLLNFIEPSAAAEGFAESGVSRSYLWGEARMQIGSGGLNFTGIVAQAGIRVEL